MVRGSHGGFMLGAMAVASLSILAQESSVRVTAVRANIRAEASETSPVLTQVTAGTRLELLATEGDWFRVRVAMGTMRVEAYISKKVATVDAASAARGSAPPAAGRSAPPAPAAAPPVASAPPIATTPSRDGMSVAIVAGGVTSWLSPGTVRVLQVRDKVDSVARLAASMPPTSEAPASTDASTQVTYVWAVDGKAASRVLEERRPTFVAVFKDVPGVGPDDLIPVLVKLSPAAPDVRLIAAARGRADEAARDETDWDLMKELKQDVVRADTQVLGRGTARIHPLGDLPPGEYAIVLRPTAKRRVAGRGVLGNEGEGHAFGAVWEFAIK